jgi:hypothetical protein
VKFPERNYLRSPLPMWPPRKISIRFIQSLGDFSRIKSRKTATNKSNGTQGNGYYFQHTNRGILTVHRSLIETRTCPIFRSRPRNPPPRLSSFGNTWNLRSGEFKARHPHISDCLSSRYKNLFRGPGICFHRWKSL